MASAPDSARKSAAFDRFECLHRIGSALGCVKAERRITLPDMAEALGRSEDQVARYIAGDDMPVSLWMKALVLWPELLTLIEETEADRAAKGRQIKLDLGRKAA